MDQELFHELVGSVEEGGAILRGETEASRTYRAEDPDVVALREEYQVSPMTELLRKAFLRILSRSLLPLNPS